MESDSALRADVLDALTQAGFDARVAANLAMGREAAASHCDAILLDAFLPDGTGIELCRELREEGRAVPIIMMSSDDQPEDRVSALETGADDYVVKPFYMPEVVARVRSVLRRAGKSGMGRFIRHLDLWLDADQVIAGRADEVFKLKPREFSLLSFLIGNPGRAWTRKQLLDSVWGHEYD
ncbi:MAG: response regulator transcription factor, partial [Planctomycetota bacterium]